jgi:hypothetical protein
VRIAAAYNAAGRRGQEQLQRARQILATFGYQWHTLFPDGARLRADPAATKEPRS